MGKWNWGRASIWWWVRPLSDLVHRNNYTDDAIDYSFPSPFAHLTSFAFPLRLCVFAVKT